MRRHLLREPEMRTLDRALDHPVACALRCPACKMVSDRVAKMHDRTLGPGDVFVCSFCAAASELVHDALGTLSLMTLDWKRFTPKDREHIERLQNTARAAIAVRGNRGLG